MERLAILGGPLAGPIAIGTRTLSSGATTTIDFVARDNSGNIVYKSKDPVLGWSPGLNSWTTIGPTVSCSGGSFSDPELSERPTGELDVIVRCSSGSGHVKWKTLSNGAWIPSTGGWNDVAAGAGSIWGAPTSSVVGVPSITSWGNGRLDMVARASDGSVAYRFFDGTTNSWWPSSTEWANLGSLGTGADTDPVIVAPGTNNLAVFRIADDGNLYYRVRDQ